MCRLYFGSEKGQIVLIVDRCLVRPDNTSNFDGLRSRQGQAEAILVAYDIMEMDGQDVRPEPLEERRKRLARLLSRSNKALRDGIQVSEAITGDGARNLSSCVLDGPRRQSSRSASAPGTSVAGRGHVEPEEFSCCLLSLRTRPAVVWSFDLLRGARGFRSFSSTRPSR